MDRVQLEQNIALFQEMISCDQSIYMWRYDHDGNLEESNCPYEALINEVFNAYGTRDDMCRHSTLHDYPVWLNNPLGMLWTAVFYKEMGITQKIYLVGPVFSTEISGEAVSEVIDRSKELEISLSTKRRLLNILKELPTVPSILRNQYSIMLHYCVTGEKIDMSRLFIQRSRVLLGNGETSLHDRRKVWEFEENLMRIVREGNTDYKKALGASGHISGGVPVIAKDSMRQAKDSVIVFISLCTRAAIRGGLSPDTAYSLGDAYIQSVEDSENLMDISSISSTMMNDFIQRVHYKKQLVNFSAPVRDCREYIETHAEEKLPLSLIAEKLGYSEYYLSRKFRRETGIGINDYIKQTKTERAKFLLSSTSTSAGEIAEKLSFCSLSHFCEVFRSIEGCTPQEYREKNRPF